MSEKIILTVEQDLAIKELIRIQGNVQVDERNVQLIKEKSRGGWRSKCFIEANSLSFADFVLALLEGYEVEKPKYKRGDILIGVSTGNVYKVNQIAYNKSLTVEILINKKNVGLTTTTLNSCDVRHATPEEIIFAELGREVGQFVEGDVYIDCESDIFLVTSSETDLTDSKVSIREVTAWYKNNDFKGFYPNTSYISFGKP